MLFDHHPSTRLLSKASPGVLPALVEDADDVHQEAVSYGIKLETLYSASPHEIVIGTHVFIPVTVIESEA